MTTERKSVFKRGADDGFWAGIYLSVLVIVLLLSVKSLLAGMLGLTMAVCVPVATYLLLRRTYRADYGTTRFSELWMQGICTFFFGSLIMAVALYVFLEFIDSGYIYTMVGQAVETYRAVGTPEAVELADILQKLVDGNMLPSPIMVAVDMIWTVSFTGSVLSLLLSLIVRVVPLKKRT